VAAATRYLERTAAWARRGKGGAVREPTAGLLMANFDHHTSRELDPQLHSHVFIFNLAPRKDGTWGAIVSRELYKAQKLAGTEYRAALAQELERAGYAIERVGDSFRVAAIPRRIERAFSKRRQAIEAAIAQHGYRSPKGMELAALRTRRAKRAVSRDALFDAWRAEARELGFELTRGAGRGHVRVGITKATPVRQTGLARATSKMTFAVQEMQPPDGMPGLAVDLQQREREFSRG
jgi:conjugative relaxase-like TrwC/TraI family protein